jgi:hypothetical protein
MNDLILVNIEGGFALCRLITTLTEEQARSLGASLSQVTAVTEQAPTKRAKSKEKAS